MLVETEPFLEMMSPEQKAAQMLMVTYPWTELTSEWEAHFRKCPVGGVLLEERNFQKASQVRALVESLQDFARETGVGIPLTIAVAQEGGSASALSFARANHPGNMALGATRNSEYAYEAARMCAGELRSFGFTVNFAPIADINASYLNPVIGVRSYGEREDMVSQMTVKTIKGMQENGVSACVSHFPGMGAAGADCYQVLAPIQKTADEMTAVEMQPFAQAIKARVDLVMLANATYPLMDKDGFPASLSTRIVAQSLRNELGYKGVVVTDALDVKSILDKVSIGDAAMYAVRAGADMVLSRGGLEAQLALHQGILEGINRRFYGADRIGDSATRVLKQKFRRSFDPLPFRDDPSSLMQQIARDSITVVRNWDHVLPLKLQEESWIGVLSPHPPNRDVISLGEGLQGRHNWVAEALYDPQAPDLDWGEISDKFANCETLVLVTFSRTLLAQNQVEWLNRIRGLEKPTVIISLDNPYHLMHFPDISAYVATYGYSPYSLEALVDVLLGDFSPRGRLPVTIPDLAEYGEGVTYHV